MKSNDQHFKSELARDPQGGTPHWVYLIQCAKCPAVGRVPGRAGRSIPPSPLAEKFRREGWLVGQRSLCPDCAARHALQPVTPKEKDDPMTNKPAPQPSPQQPRAEPPRAPTLAERRAILDELSAHYDEERQRYRAAFSDKAIAAKLTKPERWVAEVREQFFGPDRNEAAEKRDAELERLREELKGVEELVLKAMERMEAVNQAVAKLSQAAA